MAPLRVIPLVLILFTAGDPAATGWNAVYNEAVNALEKSEFETARKSAENGFHFWRGSPEADWHWRFRLVLAEALQDENRLDESSALLIQHAPRPEFEARRLVDLAFLSYRNHQSVECNRFLDRAQALTHDGFPKLIGKIELIRGMVQLRDEKTEEAAASFHRALSAEEGSHSSVESLALSDLGLLSLHQNHYDEALFWFTQAKTVAGQSGSQQGGELAQINIGYSFLALGDSERALKSLTQAYEISERLRDLPYQIRILVLLGQTQQELGRKQEAVNSFRRALAIASSVSDGEWVISILDQLSQISLDSGDFDSAVRLNHDAANLAHQMKQERESMSVDLQAAEIMRARKDATGAEAKYRAVLKSAADIDDPVALWRSHAGLASLYAASRQFSDAELEYRKTLDIIERQRSDLSKDESKFSFLSHLIRFYQEYVDFLMERHDIAGAFRVAESCRARVLAENLHSGGKVLDAPGVKRLQRASAATHEIFLSYWLAPRRSVRWVIDSAGLHHFPLPPASEIDQRVREYEKAIEDPESPLNSKSDAGRWLFTQLVASHYSIPAGSKVTIEPDGSLHQLNFESLPAGAGSHFWIEDATVAITPSLSLLDAANDAPPQKRLLLFGDVNYESTEFPRLGHVKAEVQAVAQRFPSKDLFTSSAATPAAYRSANLDLYSTLHFATHAVANREDPLDSAIILSGPEGSYKLYAHEIMQKRLHANLVTLSACRTADSRTYRGEGLTGFSWAFLSAGARNVVASLWEADDRATEHLMESFYNRLSTGDAPAAALRQAKLDLMASTPVYRRPFYWAAFETFTRAL